MNNARLPATHRDPVKLLKLLKTKPESYWINTGRRRALKLFREMSVRVPAYKDFLRKNKINPDSIKSFRDLPLVPTLDKNNYLRKYSLEKLCWDGKFSSSSYDISATSGSTGEPFYFPRQVDQDLQYALLAELYLRTNFSIHKKKTLYVNAFPLGIWIGGLFTYSAIKRVAERSNYSLSIINPGIDQQKIINVVKKFGKDFDQVIIGCYGPFLKDTLDSGLTQGINWKKYNLGFIFSAEGFTESFRDYVLKVAGAKNSYTATLNHYGTVDQGTHSYETPLSILVRRKALEDKDLYKSLFLDDIKLPTLTQYDPNLFYFEVENDGLICSAHSGLPLFRYDLKDYGGILSYSDVTQSFKKHGLSLQKESRNAKIQGSIWKLPFVYVYERKDFSVSLYAFQIYPETIRKALFVPALQKYVTGRFTMLIRYDKKHNQQLVINIELRDNKKQSKTLKERAIRTITKQLLADSSEYAKTYATHAKRIAPRVIFWPHQDPKYFSIKGKQRWIQK